jgi:3',5'-cyclic AMP phosphodiesterase CpdA
MTIKILHLSDLHFGTEKDDLVKLLIDDVQAQRPDIVIISGDLTQRARKTQFIRARNFLNDLKAANVICVPGNHDIPLYNILQRFTVPFYYYKKYITQTLCVSFFQNNLAILGVNSVTPYKPMGGYVTDKQLQLVTDFFAPMPDNVFKIVVMHHNLIKSERHSIINDAEKLIKQFAECNVNIILSGHIHYPWVEQLKRGYIKHNMYVITAGTAISTRTIVPNSYNLIELDLEKKSFSIIYRNYQDGSFKNDNEQHFIW